MGKGGRDVLLMCGNFLEVGLLFYFEIFKVSLQGQFSDEIVEI